MGVFSTSLLDLMSRLLNLLLGRADDAGADASTEHGASITSNSPLLVIYGAIWRGFLCILMGRFFMLLLIVWADFGRLLVILWADFDRMVVGAGRRRWRRRWAAASDTATSS